jgi:hypothetical protein
VTSKQHLFSFIVYLDRDVTMYDILLWKWKKNALNDDGRFIASCNKFFIIKKFNNVLLKNNLLVASNACSLILGL